MLNKLNTNWVISLLVTGTLAQGDVYIHPRLELERETEIMSEEFKLEGFEKILFVYDTQLFQNDFDPTIKNEPTFLAYFNVTVEDTSHWPDGKQSRMCLQIWDTDKNSREQIRFVNMNTIADEDHAVIIPEFDVQFSYTSPSKNDAPDGDDEENMKDLNYFCSRETQWGGIIRDNQHNGQGGQGDDLSDDQDSLQRSDNENAVGDVPTVELPPDLFNSLNNVVNNAESDENTSPEEDKPTTVSGLFVPSQWMFIDDKSNGLGDMIEASVFWSKKSMHVTFRRPLKPNSDKTMDLVIGKKYKVLLQFGLFDSHEDTDKTKLRGMIKDDPVEMEIVPISNPGKVALSASWVQAIAYGSAISMVILGI